ncbi:DUF2237 domain-containing protein [Cryomorphaceae bacterium 1068]|nr:DUF2237 domain-containing protein [Cryomorphaceae bacterium 1068]
MEQDLNVFGEKLITCSTNPMTGFYRNGCCSTGNEDQGTHTVCCIMTLEFLRFTKAMGNDLSTPVPEFEFPGLKPGDHWCLCALRWQEAYRHGAAPKVILEATNEKTLEYVSMDELIEHAYKTVE